MKVLHITYTDAGGAGIAAMRIHKSLCKHGIESSMLVADKTSHEESVYTAENCFTPSYIPPKNKIRHTHDAIENLFFFLMVLSMPISSVVKLIRVIAVLRRGRR